MCRLFLMLVLSAAISVAAVKKTVLDLMVEGRFSEARTMLADNNAGARYQAMLDAMTTPDAAAACKLYRQISERFPGTDCDSLAQERLLMALEMGISLEGPALEMAAVPVEQVDDLAEAEAINEETMHGEEPAPMTEPEVVQREMQTPVVETELPDIALAALPAPIEGASEVQAEVQDEDSGRGVTVDYREDTVEPGTVQNASATPEQSMAAPESQQDDAGEPLASPAQEKVEAAAVESKPEPVVEPVIEDKAPMRTPISNSAAADVGGDLALLESKPGLQPLPAPDAPHDLVVEPQRNGSWFVQVGAFGNHDNAHRLAAKLRSAGYPVVLVPRESGTTTLMQVRVGGYDTPDHGKTVASELKEQFDVPVVVVSR